MHSEGRIGSGDTAPGTPSEVSVKMAPSWRREPLRISSPTPATTSPAGSSPPPGCAACPLTDCPEEKANTVGRKSLLVFGGHDEPVPTLRFRVTPTVLVVWARPYLPTTTTKGFPPGCTSDSHFLGRFKSLSARTCGKNSSRMKGLKIIFTSLFHHPGLNVQNGSAVQRVHTPDPDGRPLDVEHLEDRKADGVRPSR